ncbi:MAG: hypothetical protein GX633_02315, partial [Clostridiales bacterium]|nr:hypothetical protein [Clostridiales bacterium]
MKYCFKNADNLLEGIAILAPDLDITISDAEDADIVVNIEETDEELLLLTKTGNAATIRYGSSKSRFFRALAMLVKLSKENVKEKLIREEPL